MWHRKILCRIGVEKVEKGGEVVEISTMKKREGEVVA
jgi:hypothetical protein